MGRGPVWKLNRLPAELLGKEARGRGSRRPWGAREFPASTLLNTGPPGSGRIFSLRPHLGGFSEWRGVRKRRLSDRWTIPLPVSSPQHRPRAVSTAAVRPQDAGSHCHGQRAVPRSLQPAPRGAPNCMLMSRYVRLLHLQKDHNAALGRLCSRWGTGVSPTGRSPAPGAHLSLDPALSRD